MAFGGNYWFSFYISSRIYQVQIYGSSSIFYAQSWEVNGKDAAKCKLFTRFIFSSTLTIFVVIPILADDTTPFLEE